MNIKKNIFLLTLSLLLIGCSYKTPKCSDNKVIENIENGILFGVESTLEGRSTDIFNKLKKIFAIEISEITTEEYNQSVDLYTCNALLKFRLHKNLDKKIYDEILYKLAETNREYGLKTVASSQTNIDIRIKYVVQKYDDKNDFELKMYDSDKVTYSIVPLSIKALESIDDQSKIPYEKAISIIKSLPEVKELSAYIQKSSKGEAKPVVGPYGENIPQQETYNDKNYWSVTFYEDHPDHNVRIDTFLVSFDGNEVLANDHVTGDYIGLDAWRESKNSL